METGKKVPCYQCNGDGVLRSIDFSYKGLDLSVRPLLTETCFVCEGHKNLYVEIAKEIDI